MPTPLQIAQHSWDNANPFDTPEDDPKSPCCNAELSRKGRCYGCGSIYESMKTGIQLITEERERQIAQEGWTPEHDDEHRRGELASAASAYTIASRDMILGLPPRGVAMAIGSMYWPADWGEFKATEDVVRNLTKAGALIAAEIDRLQRATA